MYVRQVAWLNAVPQGKANNKNLCNADLWKKRDLPKVESGKELIIFINELGYSQGQSALSYQEIKAWADLNGHKFDSWVYNMLKKMSVYYVSQSIKSTDLKEPAPYLKVGVK